MVAFVASIVFQVSNTRQTTDDVVAPAISELRQLWSDPGFRHREVRLSFMPTTSQPGPAMYGGHGTRTP